ncbi:MAG TPA: hypothetical protein VNY27_08105 [Solirubrobacteraceae bacterium]|jgi:hypothetical protein|nr:hypothetical protein [Solirubrobacteraceae bacterium]
MLRIQMIGLAIVAMLVMGAFVALTASAEEHGKHVWAINGTPITAAIKLHSLGLLLLEDSKATGGASKIHCKGFDDGYVFPKGLDLVLHIANSLHNALLGIGLKIHCNKVSGGCESSSLILALAVHLPWLTLLILHGTEVRDLIERDPNGPGGNPGWLVSCKAPILGTVIDECTAELGSTSVVNVTGGVETVFEKVSPLAECSQGGAGAGKVEGLVLNESPSSTETLTFQ